MPSAIEHEATVVTRLHGETLLVRIRPQASDACRGCALVSSCGPKEKRGESVEVRATAGAFADRIRPGLTVMVSPEKGATARATNLLLMLPLAGLLCGAIAGAASGLDARRRGRGIRSGPYCRAERREKRVDSQGYSDGQHQQIINDIPHFQ